MKLKILGSSSKGNCYLLENESSALIIECGVSFEEIKKALNFDLKKVVGCLISHEHLDHCKGVVKVLGSGIDVYSKKKTLEALIIDHVVNAHEVLDKFHLKGFEIMPFNIHHDAVDPIGFLIRHDECGVVLFATDTYFLKHTFKGLNNIIIESNYCEDILKQRTRTGNHYLPNRIIKSHMSIQQCIKTLQANDLSLVNNIVLIHLSDGNSHEREFKLKVEKATGKNIHVASSGMEIDFNKTPF